ncbi:hypothetical protein GXW74_15695 [Roseomonas eburnea]|uniref:Uncharacterized protein n=1 Tax=Neoroseomonas eburnea TaxID=1346889 RepID=A0A9X9XE02_9PROT|nr:hypothetical protein [Neoroseomonas eburnea]MBR0681938.1 hypothetical protein [Neoroseomonas eburnea]
MSGTTPGYWTNETSGVLRPAVEAYLRHEPLTETHIVALRAYLRQWIASPEWMADDEADLQRLRTAVDGLTSRAAIDAWIADAVELGIDPL